MRPVTEPVSTMQIQTQLHALTILSDSLWELLEAMVACQTLWLRLAPIFALPGATQHMPSECLTFAQVHTLSIDNQRQQPSAIWQDGAFSRDQPTHRQGLPATCRRRRTGAHSCSKLQQRPAGRRWLSSRQALASGCRVCGKACRRHRAAQQVSARSVTEVYCVWNSVVSCIEGSFIS